MPASTTLKRHAALVDRMATTLGVDLEQKIMEGKLDFDGLSDAVLACSGCSNPDECEKWLDAQAETGGAAPEVCRNSDLFERLKAGKRG